MGLGSVSAQYLQLLKLVLADPGSQLSNSRSSFTQFTRALNEHLGVLQDSVAASRNRERIEYISAATSGGGVSMGGLSHAFDETERQLALRTILTPAFNKFDAAIKQLQPCLQTVCNVNEPALVDRTFAECLHAIATSSLVRTVSLLCLFEHSNTDRFNLTIERAQCIHVLFTQSINQSIISIAKDANLISIPALCNDISVFTNAVCLIVDNVAQVCFGYVFIELYITLLYCKLLYEYGFSTYGTSCTVYYNVW